MELDGVLPSRFSMYAMMPSIGRHQGIAVSMLVRICRIGFSRLDENMVEIHVDSLAGFEQFHLHVEFHQKVIEP